MTCPPKARRSPWPSISTAPSTKSRKAPALARRGPDSALATTPPTVAPGPKWGGSKASICLRAASAASISASGVPQRAVITSSVGS